MVQKQIYIAAKKHNLNYVYELQKYLINSNEAKLILIKNIIDRNNIYYMHSKNFYLSTSISKIYKVTEVIFYKYLLLSNTLLTLDIEIKNTLLYLSILPTYQAKLKKNILQHLVNDSYDKVFSVYQASNLFNRCKNMQFNYNFVQIIIDKLQSSKSISRLVINLFYSGYINALFNIRNINFQQCLIFKPNKVKNLFISSYSLRDLIMNILFLDRSWFFFKTQLKKNNTKDLKGNVNKSIIANRSNIRFKISDQINFFIYDKIYRKFRLIRILNYRNKFIDNLLKIYFRCFREFSKFLFLDSVKDCHNLINVFLYTCQKRINNSNNIKKMSNLNYSVNLYINYCNIMNFNSW